MVKNKTAPTKKSPTPKISREEEEEDRPLSTHERKRLLARIAGDIAAGIIQAPSESTETPDAIAEVAINIGEALLEKIGL